MDEDIDYREVARMALADLAKDASDESVRLDAARELAMIAGQDEMRADFTGQATGIAPIEPASREAAQQRRG